MADLTDAELDRLVEYLQAAPSMAAREAATAITTLRARIAELEADRAEWVEVERLRVGKLFGWHEPTWRKVAKWANREWHEYTGPDHVKARLLLRQQWLDAGGSMDGEKAPPTPPA